MSATSSLLILILSLLTIILILIKPKVGLYLIVFSMLLSPEIEIGSLGYRHVVIRLEDLLLLIVVFTWLARTAFTKSLVILRKNPINRYIGLHILILIIATLLGLITCDVKPATGLLYLLKYIEYYILFFMVIDQVKTKKDVRMFVTMILLTGLIVCVYATIFTQQNLRPAAPFEGKEEPNTLGAYILFIFAIALSLLIHTKDIKWRIFYGLLVVLSVNPFLRTMSRGSYAAFFPMYITLTILSKRYKSVLILVFISMLFFANLIFPDYVFNRIKETYTPPYSAEYNTITTPFGTKIEVDYSTYARITIWRDIGKVWLKKPFFGRGVGSWELLDAQIPRVMNETGLFGLLIFLLLWASIFRNAYRLKEKTEDYWEKGLAIGFLAGFSGLMAHSLTASTFILIRVMEPFWFICGLIVVSLDINHEHST